MRVPSLLVGLTSRVNAKKRDWIKALACPASSKNPLTRAGWSGKVNSAAKLKVSGMYATELKPIRINEAKKSSLLNSKWYTV